MALSVPVVCNVGAVLLADGVAVLERSHEADLVIVPMVAEALAVTDAGVGVGDVDGVGADCV